MADPTASSSGPSSLGIVGKGLLRPEPTEDRVDPGALAHREQRLRHVGARGVHLRLADAAERDPEGLQRRDHRGLEVLGPVRVLAAARRGDGREGLADVLGPRVVDALDALRDAAEAVEVVPRDQVLARDAAAADLVGDQVRGEDLAQVAQVDRPGRAQARGTDDRPAGRAVGLRPTTSSARVGDPVLRRRLGLAAAALAAHDVDRSRTGLVSVPIPSTVTETVWPSTIGPTPAGVPVRMVSPGSSVITRLM